MKYLQIIWIIILIINQNSLYGRESSEYEETIFYHIADTKYSRSYGDKEILKKRDFINLFNLTSHALFDGLLVNGAKTGLGTKNPVGKSFTTESTYYQLLRIASVFDQDFMRGLSLTSRTELPGYFMASWGRLPASFLSPYRPNDSQDWQKVKKAVELMFPDFTDYNLREAHPALVRSSGQKSHKVLLSEEFEQAILLGAMAKLNSIRTYGYAGQFSAAPEKLDSLLRAYSPLAALIEADYQNHHDGDFMRGSLYLPPLYELHTRVEEDPQSWYLSKGIKKFAIKPHPVDISVGRLTHLSYLQDVSLKPFHTIKVDIEKDLTKKNALIVSTNFGRIEPDVSGSKLQFTAKNPDDGLVVHWVPNLPRNRLIGFIVDELNSIEMKAVIQRLNLLLLRKEISNHEKEADLDFLLEPKYISKTLLDRTFKEIAPDIDGSIIFFTAKRSFPAHHTVAGMSGKTFYNLLGFTCQEDDLVVCQQVFSTDESEGETVFQNFKNFVSKRLTRVVVGFIIPDIENAIDDHLSEVIDEIVDQVDDFQEKISKKIRTGLFNHRRP